MSQGLSTRREFLKTVGVNALAALLAGPRLSLAEKGKKAHRSPNIIMYLSDDHSVDFVSCYGNNIIKTPNLDALAREGMLFRNVFAASPTCAPSRSVMYTGLYPARNGAMANHTQCKADTKSLPDYLRPLGYRVVLACKVHVGPKEVFDFEYLEATLPENPLLERIYRTEGLDSKAVEHFLAEHAKNKPEQPLCLILADYNPHVIWERNKMYEPAKLPLPPFLVDTPTTRRGLANYYQDITTMDKRIGNILASLKKHGYEDNTLFIYTSDQGPEWPHCKWTLYDSGLRVPFIARWPGKIKANTICDALISFVDVTPTFIDIAGGSQPKDIDGSSFLDVFLGKKESCREMIFGSHTGDGRMNDFPQRGVRNSRYKYILNLKPENKWTTHFTKVYGFVDSHAEVYKSWLEKAKTDISTAELLKKIEYHPKEELYDTYNDHYEFNNLADDPAYKEIRATMRKHLHEWLKQQGDVKGLAAISN